jgi:hypothetical protein
MDRTNDHQFCRWRIDVEKQLFAVGLDRAALAHPQLF